MKKILLAMLCLYMSMTSYADEGVGAVSRIYPAGNVFHFRLKDNCNNSAANEYYKIYMTEQAPASKTWVAMILAASATGSELRVSVLDCNKVGDKDVRYIYQDF